ncbi:uncharacterized protein E0L32_003205 [Thyridium curvatum]|uniref:Uncharacterized protein n=1 Tax=Thyridium curvatum TaxID=1093900 RepID=A0A507BB09_9PEZI|nr:uncharacterized protein E0L32_003205 [Thyridium curvatum]TPX17087.1 hypothetical protein E0L32_003205 [Thyridium curvatum]
MELRNIILPSRGRSTTWDIDIANDNIITSIRPAAAATANNDGTATEGEQPPPPPPPSVVLPTLCHPHVHLDKAYILTCNHPRSSSPDRHDHDHPDYADLAPQDGSFQEALRNTARAKERYTPADLRLRGAQLLAAGYAQGVTCARAFVEVDRVTGTRGVAAAAELRRQFAGLVDVQVCAFAQDPVFSSSSSSSSADHDDDDGGENRREMERALREHAADVDVLGATPYVEASRGTSLANIDWAVRTALERGLHLDFHLDYNLGDHDHRGYSRPDELPLVYAVLCYLHAHDWVGRADPAKTVVLGHCTQLTRLAHDDLRDLAALIRAWKLPVHFVGLPTSDIYMMGRPAGGSARDGGEMLDIEALAESTPRDKLGDFNTHYERMLAALRRRRHRRSGSRDRREPGGGGGGDDDEQAPHSRPRGTLQVPDLIKDYGLDACLGVNNVGNAFTPFGTGDPLQLASWGVGLYHAGTPADAELLYGCVSWRARRAIGCVSRRREQEQQQQQQQQLGKEEEDEQELREGEAWRPMLMFKNQREIEIGGGGAGPGKPAVSVPARQRRDIKDIVWDPPEASLRQVLQNVEATASPPRTMT